MLILSRGKGRALIEVWEKFPVGIDLCLASHQSHLPVPTAIKSTAQCIDSQLRVLFQVSISHSSPVQPAELNPLLVIARISSAILPRAPERSRNNTTNHLILRTMRGGIPLCLI